MKIFETWKPIKGYENLYWISDKGRVKSKRKILKQRINHKGYFDISLSKNSKKQMFIVHRLVAIHFIKGYKNRLQVNHKDGNKKNNNSNNLEWATCKENIQHAIKNNLRAKNYQGSKVYNSAFNNKQIIKIRTLLNKGLTPTEIYKKMKLKCSFHPTWRVCKGLTYKDIIV